MAGYTATAGNVDWCTPQRIIDVVKKSFASGEIELDPCSNSDSIVGAKVNYILPANDGLVDSWDFKSIYVNPPYGKSYMHCTTKEILSAKEFQSLKKRGDGIVAENWEVSDLGDWVGRCSDAAGCGSEVIALIPATVDTKTWQNLVFPFANAICFIRGRVKFNGAPASAPMPVCLVYWGTFAEGGTKRFCDACNGNYEGKSLGQVVILR